MNEMSHKILTMSDPTFLQKPNIFSTIKYIIPKIWMIFKSI